VTEYLYLSLVAFPLVLLVGAIGALLRSANPRRCPACGSRDTDPADLADEWAGQAGRACNACGYHYTV
jgi:DNA-directed RNA polymerase subunit RPC12/RpoP